MCYQGKVEHYRIIARSKKLTIDEEEFFENLTQLIEHYKKDADGLCTQLTSPKKNSEAVTYHDVDFKAFRDAGWVIDEKDVKISEKIGKGEFGDVMLGLYQVRTRLVLLYCLLWFYPCRGPHVPYFVVCWANIGKVGRHAAQISLFYDVTGTAMAWDDRDLQKWSLEVSLWW